MDIALLHIASASNTSTLYICKKVCCLFDQIRSELRTERTLIKAPQAEAHLAFSRLLDDPLRRTSEKSRCMTSLF